MQIVAAFVCGMMWGVVICAVIDSRRKLRARLAELDRHAVYPGVTPALRSAYDRYLQNTTE